MKSVYLSSTYDDLKDHRQAVADVLRIAATTLMPWRSIRLATIGPKAASEAEPQKCDIYIGIFAWRYGMFQTKTIRGQVHHGARVFCGRTGAKAATDLLVEDDAPGHLATRRRAAPGPGKRIRDLRSRLKKEGG